MPFSDAFLDELRSRTSIADVVGRKVTWDNRKSNPGKGDWWAPCPFHQEKTASFHVDDKQGYYYCFGCHAKGNAISFLREAEGLGFREAVEELAQMAGMEIPAEDPRVRARAEKRATLSEVMEHAVRHFRRALGTDAGAEARAYLKQRGLDKDALERFEIGFAPPGWEGLRDALTAQKVEVEQLLACGLVRPSDKGRKPYDTFRNRIMFPIRDARGRAIAFGGRAMDPNDNAKYLNSPDTELFDKGRTLYHHGPARVAVTKGAALIVAEGYMDVIALARAGFDGAVAPLGTAITEDQLRMLWKVHPEPVVALDGDRAGLQAGERLMDIALPLVSAGQSLRFVLLPKGQDPDDVIRAGGSEAMAALLEGARPMIDLLWERETRNRVFDSPERRAGLDKALNIALSRIADPELRAHYKQALRDRKAEFFGYGRKDGGGTAQRYAAKGRYARRGFGAPPQAIPMPSTRAAAPTARGTPAADAPEVLREAVILATLIACPSLIEDFADALEDTDFAGPRHAEIAVALLGCDVLATTEAVAADLCARLGFDPLETLTAPRHVQLSPGLRKPGDEDVARLCIAGELARLEAARGTAREVAEAMQALKSAPPDYGFPDPGGHSGHADMGYAVAEDGADYDPGTWSGEGPSDLDAAPLDAAAEGEDSAADSPADALTWRLAEAARARLAADRAADGDRADFEIAPNGARIDRAEQAAFEDLLRTIGHADGETAKGPGDSGPEGERT